MTFCKTCGIALNEDELSEARAVNFESLRPHKRDGWAFCSWECVNALAQHGRVEREEYLRELDRHRSGAFPFWPYRDKVRGIA